MNTPGAWPPAARSRIAKRCSCMRRRNALAAELRDRRRGSWKSRCRRRPASGTACRRRPGRPSSATTRKLRRAPVAPSPASMRGMYWAGISVSGAKYAGSLHASEAGDGRVVRVGRPRAPRPRRRSYLRRLQRRRTPRPRAPAGWPRSRGARAATDRSAEKTARALRTGARGGSRAPAGAGVSGMALTTTRPKVIAPKPRRVRNRYARPRFDSATSSPSRGLRHSASDSSAKPRPISVLGRLQSAPSQSGVGCGNPRLPF